MARRYISAICGTDTSGPIPTKIGVHVVPHDVIILIKMSSLIFVIKFSRVLDLRK